MPEEFTISSHQYTIDVVNPHVRKKEKDRNRNSVGRGGWEKKVVYVSRVEQRHANRVVRRSERLQQHHLSDSVGTIQREDGCRDGNAEVAAAIDDRSADLTGWA